MPSALCDGHVADSVTSPEPGEYRGMGPSPATNQNPQRRELYLVAVGQSDVYFGSLAHNMTCLVIYREVIAF
jgi:hypothetical protein